MLRDIDLYTLKLKVKVIGFDMAAFSYLTVQPPFDI